MKELIKKIVGKKAVNTYHFLWAWFSALLFRFPAKKLTVIAITGTKGKTSTSFMLYHILNSANKKAGLLTTAAWSFDGENLITNNKHMTMPGRSFLQSSLSKMVRNKCEIAIVEVTSEGILQSRHKFLYPRIAAFTNLFPEHIESHGSFENYKQTKGKLFQSGAKIHVINIDDEHADFFLSFPAKEKIKVGTSSDSDFQISQLSTNQNGVEFKINDVQFSLPIFGKFFAYNAVLASAMAYVLGVDLHNSAKYLRSLPPIPGRMDEVVAGQNFKVFIDYAHEPKSISLALSTMRSLAQNSKLIVLTGSAGGGRDKQKRKIIGEVADKYADIVIIANEDPYDEDPMEIIEQIASGVKNKTQDQTLFKFRDRTQAIKKALNLASEKDVVIILGKGAETSIIEKGKKIPHNDKEVALKFLSK